MIRRQGEFLYGVAPCIAALQARRRKIYAIYAKPGSLEKKSASKRYGTRADGYFAVMPKVDCSKNVEWGTFLATKILAVVCKMTRSYLYYALAKFIQSYVVCQHKLPKMLLLPNGA